MFSATLIFIVLIWQWSGGGSGSGGDQVDVQPTRVGKMCDQHDTVAASEAMAFCEAFGSGQDTKGDCLISTKKKKKKYSPAFVNWIEFANFLFRVNCWQQEGGEEKEGKGKARVVCTCY